MNRLPRIAQAACALCILAAPGLARADAAAPPSDPAPGAASGVLTLTLHDAIQLGLEQNRTIAQAKEFQKYVRGRYVEERAAALPHLTLSADKTHSDDETMSLFGGGVYQFPTEQKTDDVSVGLSQALYTWGQVGAAVRGAKAGIASGEDQLRAFRQAVIRDVTAGFDDVLLSKELAAIARLNLDMKERHLDESRRKLAAGTATDYDVLAADVAVQNARPGLIRAENAVQGALDRLAFLLALRGREIAVDGKLDASPGPVPDYAQALATALAKRPDLAQQQHMTDVYKELVKIRNAGDKPRLDLRGAYGWRKWDLGFADASGKTWSAGLFLSFPFFDGLRTRGQTIQARSDYATQQIVEARLQDSVALEVRDARRELAAQTEILHALAGTVTQAERLLAMAEKGFDLGVKTRLDVEDAQLNLTQAKGAFARAQRDYLVAEATYRYATGTLE